MFNQNISFTFTINTDVLAHNLLIPMERIRRKFNEDGDFYMVLPSNASPNTHPNNSASDFIISWEDSFELNP